MARVQQSVLDCVVTDNIDECLRKSEAREGREACIRRGERERERDK